MTRQEPDVDQAGGPPAQCSPPFLPRPASSGPKYSVNARSFWSWGSVFLPTMEKPKSAGFRKAIHYHCAFNIKILNCRKTEGLQFQGKHEMECRLYLL